MSELRVRFKHSQIIRCYRNVAQMHSTSVLNTRLSVTTSNEHRILYLDTRDPVSAVCVL
jgi:hypothetical protein